MKNINKNINYDGIIRVPVSKQKDFINSVCKTIISKYNDFNLEKPFIFNPDYIIKMKKDVIVSDIEKKQEIKLKKGELLLFLECNINYDMNVVNVLANFDLPNDNYKEMIVIPYDYSSLGDYVYQFCDEQIFEVGIMQKEILNAVSIEKYLKAKYNFELDKVKEQGKKYREEKIENQYKIVINKLSPSKETFDKVGVRKTFNAYPDYMPQYDFEQDYDSITKIDENKYLLEHYIYTAHNDDYILNEGIITGEDLKKVETYWEMLVDKHELEFEQMLIENSEVEI